MLKVWNRLRTWSGGWFLPVCLILGLQLTASRALSVKERKLATPALHDLPLQFGTWKAHGEGILTDGVIAALKPDAYVLREYEDQTSGRAINLFVGYFSSLQNSYGPHSPRICLPGAGWLIRSSKVVSVRVPGRDDIAADEYVMEKSGNRILVLYWYQNSRGAWAEEFWAKLTLLPDLLRYRRSDASLIRLITPLEGTDTSTELADCLAFTQAMFPAVSARLATS